MVIVNEWHSYGPGDYPSIVFDSEEEAREYIRACYEEELHLQIEEYGRNPEGSLSDDGKYAQIEFENGDMLAWSIPSVEDKRVFNKEKETGNYIEIECGHNRKLCAESNWWDTDYREIYLYLKDEDGIAFQDLAIVGQEYGICGNDDVVVPREGQYFLKLYRNENSEDWTDEVIIREHEEEED